MMCALQEGAVGLASLDISMCSLYLALRIPQIWKQTLNVRCVTTGWRLGDTIHWMRWSRMKWVFYNEKNMTVARLYRRIIEPAYHYLTIMGVGALPGTYVHRLWMRARFHDCNESTWVYCVWWLIRMDVRWSGRKDMADQMLSPRHGATESPTCPIHYLEAHNSVEETETFIRKPRANPIHRILNCVHASS